MQGASGLGGAVLRSAHLKTHLEVEEGPHFLLALCAGHVHLVCRAGAGQGVRGLGSEAVQCQGTAWARSCCCCCCCCCTGREGVRSGGSRTAKDNNGALL